MCDLIWRNWEQGGSNMKDYSTSQYDEYINWFRKQRKNGIGWEELRYARKGSLEGLKRFLENKADEEFWKIDENDYYHIYELVKSKEENIKLMKEKGSESIILAEGEGNAVSVPLNPNSSWQLYKKKLIEKGFQKDSVESIERTTESILQRLNSDTTASSPVKGLVIGNVQSGKTANMAALMAMAADYGWNMFIVLSGVIESLREQTQTRLFEDLNCDNGNNHWIGLEHLSKKSAYGQRAQDCRFKADDMNHPKYFTVSLKIKSRLKDLIQWLQEDRNKQKQMKILVIDDEADQASINTADVTTEERKAINDLICNLVNGKMYDGKECTTKYKAMNYIGYTATPYANVLNEAGEESLYPKDFIAALNVSNEYFGPQQIFGITSGVDTDSYDGMNIINEIDDEDRNKIQEIHDGECFEIPTSLQRAICWFICCIAVMRFWNYKKPVSMLVHTSQKTDHHQNLANVIESWFSNSNSRKIIEMCRDVYEEQTNMLTKDIFRDEYKDYGIPNSEIKNYPDYRAIEDEINHIINLNLSKIKMNESEELKYGEGIHLCIDNCMNNGINEDNEHVRLIYPSKENMPNKAPAFLVIGGHTLSRGLTLEGLLSTYFLRSATQADTLMQMGRWFGYRKGYELLPRIWLTNRTKQQFEFLSNLDQELRNEISMMEISGTSLKDCGPKIMNTPSVKFIRITNAKKMQSAKAAEYDFSGSNSQTQLFTNDLMTLTNNYNCTLSFINSLGNPSKCEEKMISNNLIWRNVDNQKVINYVKQYKFNKRQYVFDHIDQLLEWTGKMIKQGNLKNWNIILHNQKSNNNISFPLDNFNGFKIQRTQKAPFEDGIIRIGALRDPSDLISDINLSSLSDSEKTKILTEAKAYKKTYSLVKANLIRKSSGLETVPQMIVYCIDKDSKPGNNTKQERRKLGVDIDVIGLSINIPGGKKGRKYSTYLTIDLKKSDSVMEGDGEVE